jgi:molecular chaperone DnaK (HSP70)
MSGESPYIIGIDLGTTNCAMAFVEPGQGASVQDFPVPQLQRPGEVAALALLPSVAYLPADHELPPGSTRLPWGDSPRGLVGEFARWQGARTPGRLVSSAKSWLSYAAVDRTAAILPWGAPEGVERLSPVEASAAFLQHMADAWHHAHPDAPLSAQEVVVTVPASFDEVARSLTVSAARRAGLEKFTLLEEPQAAFYDFTAQHRKDLERALENIRLVLVVDVGGGTSDFTLVAVSPGEGGPALRRIAVGEHLMLGGDNMDATIGRRAEEQMTARGRKLSAAQWIQLVQAARLAKEALLSPSPIADYNLSIPSEGSRLLGGTLSARLKREAVEEIVLDGFLPFCTAADKPQRDTRVALRELGLPYASDPAITRHLAAFLQTHATAGWAALGQEPPAGQLPRPDAILLNGGVFKSPRLAERLVQVLSSWWPQSPPIPLLAHSSLDLAVARGAAWYGLVRRGLGKRISGGAAHALYVGLDTAAAEKPLSLCVIPRGQEEGESVDLGQRNFLLQLGKPVRFPLYSTAADKLDKAGDVVAVTEDLGALPPIHTLLAGGGGKAKTLPVHLRAMLTEIGTLELWCVSDETSERWRLEFELRGAEPASAATTVTESMPESFGEARLWIDRIYGGKSALGVVPKNPPPKDVRQLWNSLERTLGPRESWRLPVLRELWSALFAGAAKRRRSADHERVFFQLLGYSLRPGWGYPLDEWRCEQSASLFTTLVEFHKEKPSWAEFWILWRRIAGGLNPARQQEVWSYVSPHLAARIPLHGGKSQGKAKGVQPEGFEEMVRLAASLEHLEIHQKSGLAGLLLSRLKEAPSSGPWVWALGRVAARVPLYGSVHLVLPAKQAVQCAQVLMSPDVLKLEGALFALAQTVRLTGDRQRDVDEGLRLNAIEALKNAAAPATWIQMASEHAALEAADEARALGDSLPAGLRLA